MADDIEVDDFAAGFDGTDTAPTETPDPTHTPAPVEPPAPKLAHITEEQFQQLLSKATTIDEIKAAQDRQFGTAFGKIGGIERLLSQLQSSTQSGQKIEVSDEDFAELREEYPELAALQVKSLNKALSRVRGTGQLPAFNPAEVDQRLESRLNPALEQIKVQHETEITKQEMKLLRAYHRDWKEVVNTDAFKDWEKTLPKEEQQKLINSKDAEYIADQLDRFKVAQKASAQKSAKRQDRFEAAVTPRGTGGHAQSSSEDDDFQSGFKTG